MTEEDMRLGSRLIRYTAQLVALSDGMPSSQAAKELATELLRATMEILPCYRGACEMESDRAFLEAMRKCQRSLQEAHVWLEVIEKSGLAPQGCVNETLGQTSAMEATFARIIEELERWQK